VLKRRSDNEVEGWLFLHSHGDYEYRNPDSVYIHRWQTFRTEAEARDWLDRCVAKVEQPQWTLYRPAAVPVPEREGDGR
jgi:hypothetical protein